jgi:hypothetical protein
MRTDTNNVKFTLKDGLKIATPVIIVVSLILAMVLSSCGSSRCHAGYCDAYSANSIEINEEVAK